MIEKKLVERDVEVQKVVTEKRTLEVCIHNGIEYVSKDELKNAIQKQISKACENLIKTMANHCNLWDWHHISTLENGGSRQIRGGTNHHITGGLVYEENLRELLTLIEDEKAVDN